MSDQNSKAQQQQQQQSSRTINMRYYENELPQLNELVLVKYVSLTDNSAYVQLTEYANIPGMITFSELHRGRITSISQYASIGKEDIMVVIRLDPVKRYIDLSRRTLKKEDREFGNAKAQRGRDVLNYMCSVADACRQPLQDMMEKVAWPLYKRFPEGGGALEAMKLAVTKSDEIFGPLEVEKKVRQELDRLVLAKLKPKVRKYECEVSVTCTTIAGVESIKEVLLAGQAAATSAAAGSATSTTAASGSATAAASGAGTASKSETGVSITVKASPHYLLRTQSFDREAALRTLWTAVNVMKEKSKELSVTVELNLEPSDVSGEK